MFDPFFGWFFNPEVVADPGAATSPPYDVISDAERDDLAARSPYNIVRLLLPGLDPASYERAAAMLEAWRSGGVLVRDDGPAFYLYTIDYAAPGGGRRLMRGVIGSLELLPLGRDVVPHEETMGKHRADRMAILTATRSNLDPIIALSAAPELDGLLQVPDTGPRLDFAEADGSRHRLYDMGDAASIDAVSAAVGGHPVSIADGHHRYTTALAYRESGAGGAGPGPWDGIMALVAPAEGSGLTIGPYHRILPRFTLEPGAVDDAFEVSPARAAAPAEPGAIVVVGDGEPTLLRPRPAALLALPVPWRSAGAAVAAELLYPRLGLNEERARYEADASAAVAAAQDGEGTALLFAPVTEGAVAAAGEEGLRFPTKTTFFTPKPRAGLVVRCFDDPH